VLIDYSRVEVCKCLNVSYIFEKLSLYLFLIISPIASCDMLESRIFTTQQALSRLCSSTATSLRRHRPIHASYSAASAFLNKTNVCNTTNTISNTKSKLVASRPFSTSRAQLCKEHNPHACSHPSEVGKTASPISPGSRLFHTMSNVQDKRPEVGQGSGGHMQNTPSKKDDDYKNRPPYRTTDKDEQFEKRYTAHCHCARIKYWLSREKPLATKFCHCIDCQSQHGTYFFALYPPGNYEYSATLER